MDRSRFSRPHVNSRSYQGMHSAELISPKRAESTCVSTTAPPQTLRRTTRNNAPARPFPARPHHVKRRGVLTLEMATARKASIDGLSLKSQ